MAQWVQLVTQQIRTKTDTTTGELTEYSYDEFGNLERVDLPGGQGTINYRTDPRNRRIGRVVQNGRGEVTDERYWVYKDQLNPIAELDAQGRVTKRFVYGERANVASYMVTYDDTGAPTGTYRLIVDHLGSVRMVVDTADGHIAQRMRYDAFGNVLADTNEGFQPFGFAGGLSPIIYGPSAAAHQHPNPIISLLNDAMHRLRGSISGFER